MSRRNCATSASFSVRLRARSVEPMRRARFRMSSDKSRGAAAPPSVAMLTIRPPGASTARSPGSVAAPIGSNTTATLSGPQRCSISDTAWGPSSARSAPAAVSAASLSAVRVVAATLAPTSFPIWIAASPTPEAPAWMSTASPAERPPSTTRLTNAVRNASGMPAAGIPEAFHTAFVNLVVEGGLSAGDAVLIHAGASGVGLAAIQMGKLVGAKVAATTRTADKLAALTAAGADLALLGPHAVSEIEQRWGPDSVAVVLDPIGAATLPGDLAVLAPGGRIVSIATLGGAAAPLDLSLLMRKRARAIGSMPRATSRTEKAALVAQFRRDILPAFDSGALRVTVDSVFPPARAVAAFQRMRDNANTGKIVIDWR